jgi:hypothetical protein
MNVGRRQARIFDRLHSWVIEVDGQSPVVVGVDLGAIAVSQG